MRIGIDAMGGDFAPDVVISGTMLARKQHPDGLDIVLIGNESVITQKIKEQGGNPANYSIVHAADVIEMGDNPAKAFSQKQYSSIAVGFQLLNQGKIDGFASAGNTGAMLVAAMYTIKPIPGVIRPSITAAFPKDINRSTFLLDVGINPDCRPDVLYQYAILGSLYAKNIFEIDDPKVGLLNIGTEEEKGNLLTKSTYHAMKGTKHFNFIGNIEGNDLISDDVDVAICDGFVGNVILKVSENFYNLVRKHNVKDAFFEQFNPENYGGTPLLGVNKPVIIGHGNSNQDAIKNMIFETKKVVETNLCEKIREAFNFK